MQETYEMWVQYLGGEDPLEEGVAPHSSILAWRIPMDRGAWRATVHGVAKSRMWLKWLSKHARLLFTSHVYTEELEACLVINPKMKGLTVMNMEEREIWGMRKK